MSVSDFQDYDFKPAPKAQSRGCLFYGCVFAGVAAVLLAALLGVVAYMSWSWYTSMISEYTEDQARPLPAVSLPPEELETLTARTDAFRRALEQDKPLADDERTLILTGDELNALIDRNEDFKGKVAVTIEDDKVKGEVSLPLGEMGLPKAQGRFLNGQATFKVGLKDDELVVTVDEATVKGEPLPESFLEPFRNENLVEKMDKDPKISQMIERLERVEVKDGKIIITARPRKPDGPGAPEGAPAPTPPANPEGAADPAKSAPDTPPAAGARENPMP